MSSDSINQESMAGAVPVPGAAVTGAAGAVGSATGATAPTAGATSDQSADATAGAAAPAAPADAGVIEASATPPGSATSAATAAATTGVGGPGSASSGTDATAVTDRKERRIRLTLVVLVRRLIRLTFFAALLAGGAWAGYEFFRTNQPVAAPIGDPAVQGVATPAVVQELVNAIAADDADAIRAALDPQIFSNYTAALEAFGIVRVESVDVLSTYADAPRSATVIVIHGRDIDRNPFSMNLIVIAEDGQIVRLR